MLFIQSLKMAFCVLGRVLGSRDTILSKIEGPVISDLTTE